MFFLTLFIGIFLDFITKKWALIALKGTEWLYYFQGFFGFTFSYNSGIAFSFPVPEFFLRWGTFILILGIFYYFFRHEFFRKNRYIHAAYGFLLAGAVGNGFERIMYGKVVDFIFIKHFAIFNVADILIHIGFWFLIIHSLSKKYAKNS